MTILSNVRHVGISISVMVLRLPNAFLEYEGLSFEILYRGDHFDEKAYRDIFHKLRKMLILILVSTSSLERFIKNLVKQVLVGLFFIYFQAYQSFSD